MASWLQSDKCKSLRNKVLTMVQDNRLTVGLIMAGVRAMERGDELRVERMNIIDRQIPEEYKICFWAVTCLSLTMENEEDVTYVTQELTNNIQRCRR